MLPGIAAPNVLDGASANAVQRRDSRERLTAKLPDGRYVRVPKNRSSIAFAGMGLVIPVLQSRGKGMANVLGRGRPLKILQSIVSLNAALVVGLSAIKGSTEEGFRHQARHVRPFAELMPPQTDLQVTRAMDLELENEAITPNPTKVRDPIQIFPADDRSPLFAFKRGENCLVAFVKGAAVSVPSAVVHAAPFALFAGLETAVNGARDSLLLHQRVDSFGVMQPDVDASRLPSILPC